MSDDVADQTVDVNGDELSGEETLVDTLSGATVRATPKTRLVQKVLRQLIETYGFDRGDIRTRYRLTTPGRRQTVDIVIFRRGKEALDEHVERVIVCQHQRPREKLRSPQEASGDLRKLHQKLELLPACHLGMWTNGREEFFVRVEETRFETRFVDIGAWPAPGERTEDVLREGGATQVAADPDDLESTLGRCHQYLTRNLSLIADAFKPLGALLLAKTYDETQPTARRRVWVRGEEPFEADGQAAIHSRVVECLEEARQWQPGLLRGDWGLVNHVNAEQTARLVTELARYSLADSLPMSRTAAFRSGARSTMDGRQGRYPTPLNVARMAVEMLAPGPDDRVFDGSCGTGTFLAMAAAYRFERFLADDGTTPHAATRDQLQAAQAQTARWAAERVFGCDLAPSLVVATRLNMLLTAGHPGHVYRIDARTFPDGELEDQEPARAAAPEDSMDIVLTNPWFSNKEPVTDSEILRRYDLGHAWNRTDDGHFVNTGAVKSGGVPPEVLFLERAWRWAKPGTGRIAILLPDGLLGNPGDEYVRWWILRHCEVLASVDLPVEPFKVTLRDYQLTPALPSLLVLRRRSNEELNRATHADYWVFMAAVDRAGVDARGNALFERAPDGEELIFEDTVIERVRTGGEVRSQTARQRRRHVDDELPTVAQRYRAFIDGGRVGP